MSQSKYEVALQYPVDKIGYLSYDLETKKVEVVLPEESWKQRVLDFLHQDITLEHATGLSTYETITIAPLASVENLKLALTRLWEKTDVQVDWTRPIEIIKNASIAQ